MIEVADLYRIERYILHHSVYHASRQNNPVAPTHKVVLGQLESGHKAENGIFENQHQNGSKSPQPRYKFQRRYPGDYRRNQNNGNTYKYPFKQLYDTFQRTVAPLIALRKYMPERIDRAIDIKPKHTDKYNTAYPLYPPYQVRCISIYPRQKSQYDKREKDISDTRKKATFYHDLQCFVARMPRQPHKNTVQHDTQQPSNNERKQQYQHQINEAFPSVYVPGIHTQTLQHIFYSLQQRLGYPIRLIFYILQILHIH